MEDLISIGTIGLIKAIEGYRPNKGTKLAIFAARCIENGILIMTEDVIQKIFVLNQLIKTHEKGREQIVKWCSEEYFR